MSDVRSKGRLEPGRMLLIDFEQGRMIPDEELKKDVYKQNPYMDWVNNQVIDLDDLSDLADDFDLDDLDDMAEELADIEDDIDTSFIDDIL